MDRSKLIQEFDEHVNNKNIGSLNGSLYESLCKEIALACFQSSLNEEGVFFLSESHAASLRLECVYQENFQSLLNSAKNPSSKIGLDMEYVSFHSSFMGEKYQGLMARLKEMPKEWTVVQMTRSFNERSRWIKRKPNSEPTSAEFHIVNYSCGDSRVPCHVMLPKPDKTLCGSDIIEDIYNISVKNWVSIGKLSATNNKIKRMENCAKLKLLVNLITQRWLKEWSCLLLGKFLDTQVENFIRCAIDDVLSESSTQLNSCNKVLLYQIASGCAHLDQSEIKSAVSYVIEDGTLQENLCERIKSIKDKYTDLIRLKRHPVILILDEDIEGIPWEMTTVLRIHPVCRIPSIHFLHALYKKHEKNILNGNVIISDPNNAYFIINPEQNLTSTEKRITTFIKKRSPKWRGLTGTKPEKNEFADALTKYDLFLYCGHGNGSQFFKSSDIVGLNVKAIPFLMGCSSFQYKNLGGRVGSYCLCLKYIIAGSPCMLGTLWPITSTDTDNITITLLNHWLPGKPADLKTIEGFSEEFVLPDQSFYEPELLRILKTSRDVSLLYSNKASLVVYGLPVKI
ncbi:separin [Planococcus citri]|uniref:separin n=1 Tax=Planococcus citri TaxID=170843 RepID=UPI0031F95404